MSNSIRPIPTFYDGTMFRSRLEARWAHFFNLCKIKWQYELEGYEFDDSRYLPDFYLPDTKLFIEIKPNLNFLKEDLVVKKISEFSQKSKDKLLVFVDIPTKAKYYWFAGFTDINTGKPFLSECALVWLLNTKGEYHPLYYDRSAEADDWMFESASNFRF